MKEETYRKAKAIMDEVENLRELKNFIFPSECYSISFERPMGQEIVTNAAYIGTEGMKKMVNTFTDIIDGLITEKLKILEDMKE